MYFFQPILDQYLGPPMLQLSNTVYQQVVGSDVTIEVSVLANPLATGIWTFNDSVIDSSDPKYRNTSESFPEIFQTNFSLDITDLQIADHGDYLLTVSNIFGESVATVMLDVQCKCIVVQSHLMSTFCRYQHAPFFFCDIVCN